LTNLKIAEIYRKEVVKQLDELNKRYNYHIDQPESRQLYRDLRKREKEYDKYIINCRRRIKEIRRENRTPTIAVIIVALLLIGILSMFGRDLIVGLVSYKIPEADYLTAATFSSAVIVPPISATCYSRSVVGTCNGTYSPPPTCDAEYVYCDEVAPSPYHEDQLFRKNEFGGINATYGNTSVTSCSSIASVVILYQIWSDQADYTIYVSNGTDTYTAASGTAGTTEPAAVSSVNVTTNLRWNCNSFFGTNPTAWAYAVFTTNTGGPNVDHYGYTDYLVFNVSYTYTEEVNITPIAPADGSRIDRDNADVADPDSQALIAVLGGGSSNVNVTFYANLTAPSISGQNDIYLGSNLTNTSGYAVLIWNGTNATGDKMYAGNWTWWANASGYTLNGTRFIYVYGGLNLTWRYNDTNPNASYYEGDIVEIEALLGSYGPESGEQVNITYLADVNATLEAPDGTNYTAELIDP